MILAFGAVYVLWGSTYLAIQIGLETWPPFFMAATRFLVAGALLYAWTRARGAPRPTVRHWRSAAIVGLLLLGCGNGGVVLAQRHTHSSFVALLIGGTPLWMTLFESLRNRQAPRPAVVAGLLVGLAGVAILIGPGRLAGGEPIDPRSAALVLGASMAWSFGSISSRALPLPESPFQATAMEMLAGGSGLLAAALLTGERLAPAALSGRSLAAWLYLIAAGSLAGFSAYIWLLQHVAPSKVSTYAYVNPVIAVLLGWVVAREPITPRTLIAGTVIVGALLLITRTPPRRGA